MMPVGSGWSNDELGNEPGKCDVCPYASTPLKCTSAADCVVEQKRAGECSGGFCVCSVWNACWKGAGDKEGIHVGCSEEMQCTEEELERGGNVSFYKCETKEEENENSAKERRQLRVTLLVLAVLILLSIAFETGKDFLFENISRNLKPIVESLFAELTVLGFIGVIMFFLADAPFIERLSEELFGEGESLKELIEEVHILLFQVMVIFLLTVLALLYFAKNVSAMWHEWEEVSLKRHHEIMNHNTADWKTKKGRGICGWARSTLLNNTFFTHHNDSVTSRHMYICMRKHFESAGLELQHTKNDATRKTSSPASTLEESIEESFDFAEYLSIIQGKVLAEVVEVSWQTWAFLGVIIVFGWLFVFIFGLQYEVVLVLGIGFTVCAIDFYLQTHLAALMTDIAAQHPLHLHFQSQKNARNTHKNGQGQANSMEELRPSLLAGIGSSDAERQRSLEGGGMNADDLMKWWHKLVLKPQKILFLLRTLLLMFAIYVSDEFQSNPGGAWCSIISSQPLSPARPPACELISFVLLRSDRTLQFFRGLAALRRMVQWVRACAS
jgi:hypothetical protein